MEAIAKEAGVGVGTLTPLPKRIDIVEAVYRTDVDQLVETAETAVAQLEPWATLSCGSTPSCVTHRARRRS